MTGRLLAMLGAGLLTVSAWASTIDGKWKTEIQGKNGTLTTVLDLKSDGNALTGSVTNSGGKRAHTVTISDGKLDGDKFSFVVVQKGKNGEMRVQWQGSVSGDQLKGTRSREGGHGREFVATKQN